MKAFSLEEVQAAMDEADEDAPLGRPTMKWKAMTMSWLLREMGRTAKRNPGNWDYMSETVDQEDRDHVPSNARV